MVSTIINQIKEDTGLQATAGIGENSKDTRKDIIE